MIKCEKIPLNIKKYFKYCPADYMISSIISEEIPEFIYVNNLENPTIFIVLCHYNIYVDGVGEPDEIKEAIKHFRELIFKETGRDLIEARFLYPNEKWKNNIINALGENNCDVGSRTVYRYDSDELLELTCKNVYPISPEIMKNENITNKEMIIDEVGNIDNFFKKGFGCCVIINDKISGFCTAEYVSENMCGIGIAVIPEEREKGYASIMTQYFINMCIERKIIPYWDCWTDNIGSMKTAQKTNFTKVNDYGVIVIKS